MQHCNPKIEIQWNDDLAHYRHSIDLPEHKDYLKLLPEITVFVRLVFILSRRDVAFVIKAEGLDGCELVFTLCLCNNIISQNK